MGENENVKPDAEKKAEVKPESPSVCPVDAGLGKVEKEVKKAKAKPAPKAKPKKKPAPQPKKKTKPVKKKPPAKKKAAKAKPKKKAGKRHGKKPGRKLSAHPRHLINFKVTKAERAKIHANAKKVSSGSVSQFIRLIATTTWDKKKLLKIM